MFAYCNNKPVMFLDFEGTRMKFAYTFDGGGGGSQWHELYGNWRYRIEPANTSTRTKRHIHIQNTRTNEEYMQNDDGSPHDKKRGKKGDLPNKLQEKVMEKTGWDYNGKRKSFYKETSVSYWVEGTQYSFADGSTVFIMYSPYLQARYSIDSYESIYFQSSPISGSANYTTQVFYMPTIGPVSIPSFSFNFSWTTVPIPVF